MEPILCEKESLRFFRQNIIPPKIDQFFVPDFYLLRKGI